MGWKNQLSLVQKMVGHQESRDKSPAQKAEGMAGVATVRNSGGYYDICDVPPRGTRFAGARTDNREGFNNSCITDSREKSHTSCITDSREGSHTSCREALQTAGKGHAPPAPLDRQDLYRLHHWTTKTHDDDLYRWIVKIMDRQDLYSWLIFYFRLCLLALV